MKRNYITKETYLRLEKELNELTEKNRNYGSKMGNAISKGKTSDNGEYYAIECEGMIIDGRISQIQEILSTSTIIDNTNSSSSKVNYGTIVSLLDVESNVKYQFQFGGSYEKDARIKTVSSESIMGRALMGKHQGESFSVTLPNGKVKQYKIEEIAA